MTKTKKQLVNETKNELFSFIAEMKKVVEVISVQAEHLNMLTMKVEALETYVKLNLENKSKANYIG